MYECIYPTKKNIQYTKLHASNCHKSSPTSPPKKNTYKNAKTASQRPELPALPESYLHLPSPPSPASQSPLVQRTSPGWGQLRFIIVKTGHRKRENGASPKSSGQIRIIH